MARDGNGNYNLPEAPFVFDTVIDEAAVNNNFADVGAALTQSLSKDGQTVPTGNLPMGARRHTGVGDATERNNYAAAGQVQDGAFLWCGTAGGTANALTLSPSPAIAAYSEGQKFRFRAGANANTDAATVVISGLSALAIQIDDAALTGGEIEPGKYYEALYDGTQIQLSRLSGFLRGGAIDGTVIGGNTPAAVTATDLTATQQLVASGTLTPPQITANQNDYDPTGLADSSCLRLFADNTRTITGLAGGIEGRFVVIYNVGSPALTLADQNASSVAANRFLFAQGDLTLTQGRSVLLRYDAGSARWRGVDGPDSQSLEGLAPIPAASGVGQWQTVATASGASWVLPPGGTWAFAGFRITDAGAITFNSAGVAAGGQVAMSAVAGSQHRGFEWRIA